MMPGHVRCAAQKPVHQVVRGAWASGRGRSKGAYILQGLQLLSFVLAARTSPQAAHSSAGVECGFSVVSRAGRCLGHGGTAGSRSTVVHASRVAQHSVVH